MSTQINPSQTVASGDRAALDLPFDHRRVFGQSSQHLVEWPFALAPELTRRLAWFAERENVSLPAVYLSAYAILLSRYRDTPEVNILSSSITRGSSVLVALPDGCRSVAVLRTNCSPELSLREFLRTVAGRVAAGVEDYRKRTAQASSAALCHAGFLWEDIQEIQTTNRPTPALGTVPLARERFAVSLKIQHSGDILNPALLYRADLFERDTIERMSRHLTCLFEAILSRPEVSLAELDMTPSEERVMLLGPYAGSSSHYPHACLHQLFAEHAALRPDAEAVVFGSERLTYRELDRRSNQVAQLLVSQGICSDDRVGIFMDRSADMIVSMLGILKAGGAYVPIDPDYPAERLKFIAEDTAVRWVLTQRCVKAVLPTPAPCIFVSDADSPIRKYSHEPVTNRSTPESTAVVIYTSGSTGRPKAACIPHRAAVRTVRNTNHVQVMPEDRIGQAASPSFDAAILEIWLALANGATLVGVRRETLLEAKELTRLLRNERISIICLNTSYIHQIGRDAPEVLKGVRRVLFGGEAAEPGPLRELLKHLGPGVLVNGYGPAEGCVITTYYEIAEIPEDATTIPIGRPVSNARVYLLDRLMRPVPIGVQGEIYIGGEGVANGYLNRAELTAQRFVSDPFSEKPGRLLYRTGDFGRMRGNGEIEFKGRADEQVKIRGHRIELAEVREAIAAHSQVKQVFLMVREDNPGDKRLVAYVTLRRSLSAAQNRLRQHAKDKLPAHMLPAAFVVMGSIPLNANGKIDRKALPPPSDRPELGNSFKAAETNLERTLSRVWQELLQVDRIGINDNFFDLGGHSLLAARLIARIEKETGDNIPVATLFEAPTIAQLAKCLRHGTYASAWSPLVELYAPERITTAKPFFCVHSLGANLVSVHKLASLMRGDRPVYGLQPHGLDGQQEPLESIELIASAYCNEIRKTQPDGPYYLGGICIGGVLAYEIAQQLRAAGEEVGLLALIDSFLPGELQHLRSRPKLVEYLDWHVGEMLLLSGIAPFRYLAKWFTNGGIRLGRAFGWGRRSSLTRATQKVADAHRRAVAAYKPKPSSGKIVQLMCSDASHRAYEDRRLAWSSLVPGGFEVRIVPGNHLTMVEEPNVKVLAQELQSCLDRASGDTHSTYRHFEKRQMAQDTLKSYANVSARKRGRVAKLSSTVSSLRTAT